VSVVYFIQIGDSGPIKIGVSVDVQKRLQQLQTASPYQLRLLAKLLGGESKEAELHRRFAAFKMQGEWFSPSQELQDFIHGLSPEYRKQVVAQRRIWFPDCACDILDVLDDTLCVACQRRQIWWTTGVRMGDFVEDAREPVCENCFRAGSGICSYNQGCLRRDEER
jgi:hypothetical protein